MWTPPPATPPPLEALLIALMWERIKSTRSPVPRSDDRWQEFKQIKTAAVATKTGGSSYGLNVDREINVWLWVISEQGSDRQTHRDHLFPAISSGKLATQIESSFGCEKDTRSSSMAVMFLCGCQRRIPFHRIDQSKRTNWIRRNK